MSNTAQIRIKIFNTPSVKYSVRIGQNDKYAEIDVRGEQVAECLIATLVAASSDMEVLDPVALAPNPGGDHKTEGKEQ